MAFICFIATIFRLYFVYLLVNDLPTMKKKKKLQSIFVNGMFSIYLIKI